MIDRGVTDRDDLVVDVFEFDLVTGVAPAVRSVTTPASSNTTCSLVADHSGSAVPLEVARVLLSPRVWPAVLTGSLDTFRGLRPVAARCQRGDLSIARIQSTPELTLAAW